MKLLGLDYGSSKIGLAFADTESGLALPYKILSHNGIDNLIDELIKIIDAEKIERVVVGLPFNLQTVSSAQTLTVKNFATTLARKIKIPVIEHDERLTSQEAQRLGAGNSDDDVAAMLMLQNYLDKEKFNQNRATEF